MMKTGDKRTSKSGQNRQFCTFRIDQKLYGVNITDVKEVRPPVDFTPVFHAFEEVKGFVNVRGQIHLVIDLRVLLGFTKKEIDKFGRIVLFKPHVGESFGVLVDTIGDVVEANEALIENMGDQNPDSGEGGMQELSDLIIGNCKLDDKILTVLDATSLMRKIEKKHGR